MTREVLRQQLVVVAGRVFGGNLLSRRSSEGVLPVARVSRTSYQASSNQSVTKGVPAVDNARQAFGRNSHQRHIRFSISIRIPSSKRLQHEIRKAELQKELCLNKILYPSENKRVPIMIYGLY